MKILSFLLQKIAFFWALQARLLQTQFYHVFELLFNPLIYNGLKK